MKRRTIIPTDLIAGNTVANIQSKTEVRHSEDTFRDVSGAVKLKAYHDSQTRRRHANDTILGSAADPMQTKALSILASQPPAASRA